MTAAELLRRTRQRLEDPSRWRKGSMIDSNGRTCLVGALRMASAGEVWPARRFPDEYREAHDALLNCTGGSITGFNDRISTTHDDILRSIDCAIEKVEA